jgi:2-polyprenyl-6-methoxyphenol hydroxylase-like FAD-dependent oxidoreductase
MSTHSRKNALIIGASMAGLLAATALAKHFDHVTLLERDKFPPPGANRKGVPQGKHTHLLLEKGRQVMEAHLPGLTDELTQAGAIHMHDVSREVRWFHGDAYHQPGDSGIASLGVARPTLEAAVRARVLALPNVQAMEDCHVDGLLLSEDREQVTGVCMATHDAGGPTTMTADLVIDAGGRGSRGPAWLEEAGYGRPAEEEIRIGLGYTSCYYRRRATDPPNLYGIVCLAAPPHTRLGIILAQDGNRWVVTVGGYLGDTVPTDYQSFLAAVRALPTRDIYAMIADAEPLGKPVAYNFPSNLRRHYERMESFPAGYLVIGDAICSFNPIYGQGMTVAALEADTLEACLAGSADGLADRFFRATTAIVDASWDTAVGNDLSFPEVDGPRSPQVRVLNWYLDKVHQAAHHDAAVSIAFLKVINMVASPTALMQPRILWSVLTDGLASA